MSLDGASARIVDAQGRTMTETQAASEPEALIPRSSRYEAAIARTGLEAGPPSQALLADLKAVGLPVELLGARHIRDACKVVREELARP